MTIDGNTTLMTNGQVQTGTQFTQKIKLAAKLEILQNVSYLITYKISCYGKIISE